MSAPDEHGPDHEGHADEVHGAAPLGPVDPAPLHAAVDALAARLHEYVETSVGVRAEFGAAEADEDPRVLALEGAVGQLNAGLFDALHDTLGMHPDLTSSVWEPDDGDAVPADPDAPPVPPAAEVFYLGFVVTPATGVEGPGTAPSDAAMDTVIDTLDAAGEGVVRLLLEGGYDVVEWATSRGEAAGFEGYDGYPGDEDGEEQP